MQVPILKQRDYLIASVQAALTDADLLQLRDALVTQVGTFRSHEIKIAINSDSDIVRARKRGREKESA